jgi:class 3 adenylate cyclase/predicted ATPase
MDIVLWLRELGLERYQQAFRDNQIDETVLPSLTNTDLKDLGVELVGHRRRLLNAMAALNRPAANTDCAANTASFEQTGSLSAEAQRRQLTVMFVDLVGSTELSRRLDPEDMRDVIRSYQNAVAGEIARFEGHVAKFMGDGVLAYFGYPLAHEDEAERAVRAGLAVNEAIARIRTPQGEPVAARIGIATGLVVAGDLVGEVAAEAHAVIGETPNLAARLQALAGEGSIVISESTARLLGRIFDLAPLNLPDLKGFPEGVQAYRVIGEGAVPSRFEALHAAGTIRLVGRDPEIRLLQQRWNLASRGDGQIVHVLGAPGIGKSHIAQALCARLAKVGHIRFHYNCSPYHANSALHPVIDQLTRAAGLERVDTPETKLNKLERLLAKAGRDLRHDVPAIAGLLSLPTGDRYRPLDLSPQRRKALIFDVLIGQLEAATAENAVLMIVEDIHWIDPTSLDYLSAMVERLEHLPILFVTTGRPGTAPRWMGYPHATLMTLNRLGRSDTLSIVDDLTGGRDLPNEVLEHILSRTDGVPLFVEELTKVVLDSGLLIDNGGRLTLAGPLPPVAIPSTLQDSLMARLDRLGSEKEVAQIGAVIGRSFTHELVTMVAGLPEGILAKALDQLVETELVHRRGRPPNATYTFKHGLIQDTAYQTLLKSRRRILHARIADALENEFPELRQTQPEMIAHHCTQAGLTERAVEYWKIAGQVAMTRSATAEAIVHLESGLRVLMDLPASDQRDRQELSIQLAMGNAMVAAYGFAAPRTGDAYQRARILCERLDDISQLFAVVYGLCLFHLYGADIEAAQAASSSLLKRAKECNDGDLLFFANRAAGVTTYPAGRFSAARDHLERALSLYDSEQHQTPAFVYAFDPKVVCLDYLARTLFPMGSVDRAIDLNNEAIDEARRIGHRNSLALPLFFGATIHQLRADTDTVRDYAGELIVLAEEEGFEFWRAGGIILRGWADILGGAHDEGLRGIRNGVEAWQATGAQYMMTYFQSLIADALIDAGNARDAITLLEDAIQPITRSSERWFEAEVYRIRGEAFLALEAPEQVSAERSLRRALAIARQQGARLWELKAATSLGRLWIYQERASEVSELLSPVIAHFSEPFPTPDLAAAKRVLVAADSTAAHRVLGTAPEVIVRQRSGRSE